MTAGEVPVDAGAARKPSPRGQVFITTKFFPGHQDSAAEAEWSLRRLGVDQLDLWSACRHDSG